MKSQNNNENENNVKYIFLALTHLSIVVLYLKRREWLQAVHVKAKEAFI